MKIKKIVSTKTGWEEAEEIRSGRELRNGQQFELTPSALMYYQKRGNDGEV